MSVNDHDFNDDDIKAVSSTINVVNFWFDSQKGSKGIGLRRDDVKALAEHYELFDDPAIPRLHDDHEGDVERAESLAKHWETYTKPDLYIVCAANRSSVDGYVILGARHFDKRMQMQIRRLATKHHEYTEQGFVDQFGDFHNREDAWEIAYNAGQLYRAQRDVEKRGGNPLSPTGTLFSEDLY